MLGLAAVAGIRIRIDRFFLFLVLGFSFLGYAEKIFLFFAAVILHEAAHAWMAQRLGFTVSEIRLLPFGGVAHIADLSEADCRQDIWIAVAGPVVSALLALVSFTLYIRSGQSSEWLEVFYRANGMLLLFNLLPALPLDGGRIMRSCLTLGYGLAQATTYVLWLSWGIASLLAAGSVYRYVVHQEVHLTVLLAALFIYRVAAKEHWLARLSLWRALAGKKALLQAKGFLPTVHLTVTPDVVVADIVRLFRPHQYHILLVIRPEDAAYYGVLTETQIWLGLPEQGIRATIGQFLMSDTAQSSIIGRNKHYDTSKSGYVKSSR